ncbi:tripartite tricarboxylate transporter TctB family protein [Nakamurella leprariae]|uniref:Tripartite tricarboxylate transporter TctB family protein n=1 Tax=Nakamurella leprariae TaxID=2803911 RepID=A0A938YD97_9ACTN|nr:tripartite tricarboxylate transporter TctB family protein [Nakamurella leprariae]MBM9468557.1 tripartite tricarboxylate transporter TctB family protein [Nakamurella leprariae]
MDDRSAGREPASGAVAAVPARTGGATTPPDDAGAAGPLGTARWGGLSELVVPLVLLALAGFLIVGTLGMEVPPSVQVPGPTFFPWLVIGLLVVMAVLSAVSTLRARARQQASSSPAAGDRIDRVDRVAEETRDADGDPIDETPPDVPPGRAPWPAGAVSDWRALGIVLGSLVAFIVLLRPVGWILAAGLLFWGVAYAMGSRRPVLDISVALVMSSAIQLIFGNLLGLNLPAGFLEGVL